MIFIFSFIFLIYPLFLLSISNFSMWRILSVLFVFTFMTSLELLYYWPLYSLNISLLDGTLKLNKDILILLINILILAILVIILTKDQDSTLILSMMNLSSIIFLLISNDFLITILSFQLFNITLYLFINSSHSFNPSAIKYFLLSAYSTSFFLLGIAFIYSLTGTTNYDKIQMIVMIQEDKTLFIMSFILIFMTLLFKLGLAPMHNWAPDLYENLKYTQNLWIMIIPKLGILYLLYLLLLLFPFMYFYLIFPACLSILFGSICLASQSRMIRFLAYSSITNMGYILLIINDLFKLISYVNIYFITLIILLFIFSKLHISSTLILNSSFFHLRSPFILILSFFNLAGCPPLIGFYIKYLVLTELIKNGFYLITILLILASIISVSNYLSIIMNLLFLSDHNSRPFNTPYTYKESILLSILTLLFILPSLSLFL